MKSLAIPLGLALSTVLLAGCSRGGRGSDSLVFVHAVVEELGELPLEAVFLNSEIRVRLSSPLDPASVSTQTFRVLRGPDFTERAPGTIDVDGDTIRFRPRLPLEADRSDAGFRPDTEYRLSLRGHPELNTIRSRRGSPLAQSVTLRFTTRFVAPFFFDPVPGPPRVAAIFIDRNGDDRFDADGDPATLEDEEFFAAEHRFDRVEPFVVDVRPGSAGLPSPHSPLRIALLFDEALDPAFVTRDDDVFGRPDALMVLDLTNPYACDTPLPGDLCPRPISHVTSMREFAPAPDRSFARSLVTLRLQYGLDEIARHRIVASDTLRDLNGNRLALTTSAVFETGVGRVSDDLFIESFDTLTRRGSGTSALWNPELEPRLRGGIGFGGDGSDGRFVGATLDTRRNDGVFNFSAWDSTFNTQITGPNPAVIRIRGDFDPQQTGLVIHADGEDGIDGVLGRIAPLPGGRGGPGAWTGGSSGIAVEDRGGRGQHPLGSEGGGLGGFAGEHPGGGGGAGHRSFGRRGGEGGAGGGDGGRIYGDASAREPAPGSGGGGGGDDRVDDDNGVSTAGSGGGGGGVWILETFGKAVVRGVFPRIELHTNGGDGGAGAGTGTGSAGGGGGSGGTLLVRAREANFGGKIRAIGGRGGIGPVSGGEGSSGRIRFETLDGDARCSDCDPAAIRATLSDKILGHSIGQSTFLNAHPPSGSTVAYTFDGSIPAGSLAGHVRFDAEDIEVLDAHGNRVDSADDLPHGTSIRVYFRGAHEDSRHPDRPDPAAITPWFTNIADVDGFALLQWEVRFQIQGSITLDPADDPPAPAVDNLRIHVRFNR